MPIEPLFHLPVSDLWSDQYLLSHYRKLAHFSWNLPLYHSHSTNISRIANLDVGGERAARTAQSTYWSCPDMIRTQILNWSESCRNSKMEPGSGYKLAKKLRVYVWSWYDSTKTMRVGFLAGSGTKPNCFSCPNPDRCWVTSTLC